MNEKMDASGIVFRIYPLAMMKKNLAAAPSSENVSFRM